jgi:hypothetical protein
METNEDCRITGGDHRSLAALTLVLGALFITYFAIRTAMPELPLHVHQALSEVPGVQMAIAPSPRN